MSISRRHILGGALASLSLALTACSGASPDPSPAGSGNGSSGAAGNGQFRTLEQIKSSGTVRIGVFSDKAPFGYVDTDGKPAGYDVVYAERIGKDLGTQVEYVPVEAASRVEFLQTAKVDIILANFTVTPERKEKVDFANPYMKVALGRRLPRLCPGQRGIAAVRQEDHRGQGHHSRDLADQEPS